MENIVGAAAPVAITEYVSHVLHIWRTVFKIGLVANRETFVFSVTDVRENFGNSTSIRTVYAIEL